MRSGDKADGQSKWAPSRTAARNLTTEVTEDTEKRARVGKGLRQKKPREPGENLFSDFETDKERLS
ncbi:MAG: hypothetical protein CMJ58_26465 [Planctomycetaceae bacterium]|nr:hypothetical protein [Planctomycetaceae bacterium]